MPKLILRQYLINEELLLQEIEIGRVFLQVFHNFFHLGSPHLPDQTLRTPISGPKLYYPPCSYVAPPTLFILQRVRAGKGISQIGTGVLPLSKMISEDKSTVNQPIKADKDGAGDGLVDHFIDEISSDDKSADAGKQPEDPFRVRSEHKGQSEISCRSALDHFQIRVKSGQDPSNIWVR